MNIWIQVIFFVIFFDKYEVFVSIQSMLVFSCVQIFFISVVIIISEFSFGKWEKDKEKDKEKWFSFFGKKK